MSNSFGEVGRELAPGREVLFVAELPGEVGRTPAGVHAGAEERNDHPLQQLSGDGAHVMAEIRLEVRHVGHLPEQRLTRVGASGGSFALPRPQSREGVD